MTNTSRTAPQRLVVDGWYAAALRPHVTVPIVSVENVVLARFPKTGRLLLRRGVTKALALVASTRAADSVATPDAEVGTRWLIGLTALVGRRNLILLEYINHPPWGTGLRGWLRRSEFVVLRRLLLPRALVAAQVLTSLEVESYATRHGIQQDRFQLVPWPARFDANAVLPHRGAPGRAVLCSGRRVDWATFASAARGANWKITAVCTAADADLVQDLLGDLDAVVHVEIDLEKHFALVGAATVFVVALPETGASIGQVRIMNAADAGTPLVVSRVQGVEEYVDDISAVLVDPGSPHDLRRAVDDLLDDPDRQQQLREALFYRGVDYDMSGYLRRLGEMVIRAATQAHDDQGPAGDPRIRLGR